VSYGRLDAERSACGRGCSCCVGSFLCRAQLRRAGARVPFLFSLGRAKRLLGERFEVVAFVDEALDDPVLERVIRDRDDAATGSEGLRRPRQGEGEVLQLPVDRDAERLKRAPRAPATTRASSPVVVIGDRVRARTMAAATRRDRRSSPNSNRILASSSSGAIFTMSIALSPSASIRMSSGPSFR
jgi:hypothetical protein